MQLATLAGDSLSLVLVLGSVPAAGAASAVARPSCVSDITHEQLMCESSAGVIIRARRRALFSRDWQLTARVLGGSPVFGRWVSCFWKVLCPRVRFCPAKWVYCRVSTLEKQHPRCSVSPNVGRWGAGARSIIYLLLSSSRVRRATDTRDECTDKRHRKFAC